MQAAWAGQFETRKHISNQHISNLNVGTHTQAQTTQKDRNERKMRFFNASVGKITGVCESQVPRPQSN